LPADSRTFAGRSAAGVIWKSISSKARILGFGDVGNGDSQQIRDRVLAAIEAPRGF